MEAYEDSCLCGGINVKVNGPPVAAWLCHCEDCRTWHAAPVNAFANWPSDAVSVTQGEDLLSNYESGHSNRHWCRACGSGVMNRVNDRVTVVYAMLLAGSGYVHEATRHIHCDETVLDLQDGLPKFVDLPAEWGGSDETVVEPTRSGLRPKAE